MDSIKSLAATAYNFITSHLPIPTNLLEMIKRTISSDSTVSSKNLTEKVSTPPPNPSLASTISNIFMSIFCPKSTQQQKFETSIISDLQKGDATPLSHLESKHLTPARLIAANNCLSKLSHNERTPEVKQAAFSLAAKLTKEQLNDSAHDFILEFALDHVNNLSANDLKNPKIQKDILSIVSNLPKEQLNTPAHQPLLTFALHIITNSYLQGPDIQKATLSIASKFTEAQLNDSSIKGPALCVILNLSADDLQDPDIQKAVLNIASKLDKESLNDTAFFPKVLGVIQKLPLEAKNNSEIQDSIYNIIFRTEESALSSLPKRHAGALSLPISHDQLGKTPGTYKKNVLKLSKENFLQIAEAPGVDLRSANIRHQMRSLLKKSPNLLTLKLTQKLLEDKNHHTILCDVIGIGSKVSLEDVVSNRNKISLEETDEQARNRLISSSSATIEKVMLDRNYLAENKSKPNAFNKTVLQNNYPAISLISEQDLLNLEIENTFIELLKNPENLQYVSKAMIDNTDIKSTIIKMLDTPENLPYVSEVMMTDSEIKSKVDEILKNPDNHKYILTDYYG